MCCRRWALEGRRPSLRRMGLADSSVIPGLPACSVRPSWSRRPVHLERPLLNNNNYPRISSNRRHSNCPPFLRPRSGSFSRNLRARFSCTPRTAATRWLRPPTFQTRSASPPCVTVWPSRTRRC
uniref:(northern house mosquito) hypothetical protein n=1 Tax=Culex pipiens TaxID=7175 RepID=A0A8D7ZWP6_CULPI